MVTIASLLDILKTIFVSIDLTTSLCIILLSLSHIMLDRSMTH